MNRATDVAELLQLRAQLKTWANSSGFSSALAVVNDLAEICRAAEAVSAAIKALSQSDRSGSGKQIVEIQAWLYEELLNHAEALRDPLQEVCNDAYKTK